MGRPITKESGFTLVEILTVLVIIGLMSSVVILSMPQPKSDLDKQAALLAGQLNALAQDGLISGSVTAAGFSEDGYALYAFENSEWTERASGEWAESYRMTLERASVKLDLPKKADPIMIFEPSGLSTAFEFTLSDRETKYALTTSGDGRIELVKSVP
jgi:general secretion pathway protein H